MVRWLIFAFVFSSTCYSTADAQLLRKGKVGKGLFSRSRVAQPSQDCCSTTVRPKTAVATDVIQPSIVNYQPSSSSTFAYASTSTPEISLLTSVKVSGTYAPFVHPVRSNEFGFHGDSYFLSDPTVIQNQTEYFGQPQVSPQISLSTGTISVPSEMLLDAVSPASGIGMTSLAVPEIAAPTEVVSPSGQAISNEQGSSNEQRSSSDLETIVISPLEADAIAPLAPSLKQAPSEPLDLDSSDTTSNSEASSVLEPSK